MFSEIEPGLGVRKLDSTAFLSIGSLEYVSKPSYLV